jgi:hypothetical protein
MLVGTHRLDELDAMFLLRLLLESTRPVDSRGSTPGSASAARRALPAAASVGDALIRNASPQDVDRGPGTVMSVNEFENGNILGTSAAVRLGSGCARSATHQAIRSMSFAQVRRGQICKQGVVGSNPIVSTVGDQLLRSMSPPACTPKCTIYALSGAAFGW